MKIKRISLDDNNLSILNRIEKICFPEIRQGYLQPYNKRSATWWFVYDDNGAVVAFGGVSIEPDHYAFLCLSGVLKRCRGQGLQRRLIRARKVWAKKQNLKGIYTYTSRYNIQSSNNLIKCGFTLFEPSYKWGLSDGLYWRITYDKR